MDTTWRKILVRNVQKNIDRKDGINLLDIGCGTGDIIESFITYSNIKFSNIIGVDISEAMLNLFITKRRYLKINNCYILKADATNLPFKDNSFDVVATAFVIRNIENITALFTEIYRILSHNGIFVFLEFSLPKNYFQKKLFINYLDLWIKNIGDFFTNSKSYTYLTNSIKTFAKINLVDILVGLNFKMLRYQYLTNGIVQLGIFKK